jgi:hypothetical protein
MGFFTKKTQTLPDLAASYATWQKRLESLLSERPGNYARVLESQQILMEGEGDPQTLTQAQQSLSDLDQKIEASLGKLREIWGQMEGVQEAEVAALRQAAPTTEAELRREFEAGCARAGALFAEAMTLAENLGIHRAAVAKAMGFPSGQIQAGAGADNCVPLADGYNAVKRRPLEPKDSEWASTYRAKENDHRNFMIGTSDYNGRQNYIRQKINRAIREAGGNPPRPNHGIEGGVLHGQNL